MNSFARLPVCAGIAVLLGSVFVLLLTKLGGSRLDNNLDLAQWILKLGAEWQRHDELETRGAPVFRRTFEKRRLVQELVAHQITLRQAVAECRELNEQVAQNEPNERVRPSLDEETLSHNVILWVRAELADQPSVADRVSAELEQEMNEPPSQGESAQTEKPRSTGRMTRL